MEPIKINLTTPVNGYKEVSITDMTECNGELLIKLNDRECYNIYPGQKITFMRYVHEEGDVFYTLSESVTVLSEDEKHIIHTTMLPTNKVFLSNDPEDMRIISGSTVNEDGSKEEYLYYCIKTKTKHNIFPQDLIVGTQEIHIKDYSGNILASYSGSNISIPLKREDRCAISGDCITQISDDETCGKRLKNVITYQYNYSPEKISKDMLMISGFNPSIVEEMVYVETKYNPFYYYYIETDSAGTPTEFNEYGEVVKHCRLYTDPWWPLFNVKNNERKGSFYQSNGDSYVTLCYNDYYWNVDIGLSSPVNESTLGSYDNFNTKFVEDIEQSLIPDIIDMERVKYCPMVYDATKRSTVYYKWVSSDDTEYPEIYTSDWVYPGVYDDWSYVNVFDAALNPIDKEFFFDAYNANGYKIIREEIDSFDKSSVVYTYNPTDEIIDSALTIATSITLSFHFRERNKLEKEDEDLELFVRKRNTSLTSGHVYSDGWYINPDSADTIWWNGFQYDGASFSKDDFTTFIENSGLTSDLIGYLNFVDNDVYYKKKKVSQSFVRLLFYNSPDPIEQKLLYYSTIFVDATNLYGKYIKQLLFMEENDLFNNRTNKKLNLNAAVVFCSATTVSARVDTQMVITNEFDRTKSSEGFNLYLFAEDKNFNIENGVKTIYMKVEFNHAGNGKTIPMIAWPKDDNGYIALTANNFIESLYIPINLTYINDRYVYYIPDAYKNENGNIDLVLFEPKIDYPDDIPE